MTTAQLLATLRTQLQDANKPGLAGVRALEGAAWAWILGRGRKDAQEVAA